MSKASPIIISADDVPRVCPMCDGDGSEAHVFDGHCPAAWTHSLIYRASYLNRTTADTATEASGENAPGPNTSSSLIPATGHHEETGT